jgi:hypothetical protein
LPGTRLAGIQGALHFLMIDQPAQFRAEVDLCLGETIFRAAGFV